jgi:hypothetical protein
MDRELPLRITVLNPPPGVTFRLQRGKSQDDLVPPTHVTDDRLQFDFTVRLSSELKDGKPNLRGPLAQGSPTGRFVYVSSGTSAGQTDSCWTRRAKVPLTGISSKLIEPLLSGEDAALEARIAGTAKDGGPCCATVPLLDGGWKVVRPKAVSE